MQCGSTRPLTALLGALALVALLPACRGVAPYGAAGDANRPADHAMDGRSRDLFHPSDSNLDSSAADSSAAESGATESGAAESGAMESGAMESGAMESGATDSSVADVADARVPNPPDLSGDLICSQQTEVCNGFDDNCNGLVDDGACSTLQVCCPSGCVAHTAIATKSGCDPAKADGCSAGACTCGGGAACDLGETCRPLKCVQGACVPVPRTGPCAGGTCVDGVCCSGCVLLGTCKPGNSVLVCGKGGVACQPCLSCGTNGCP